MTVYKILNGQYSDASGNVIDSLLRQNDYEKALVLIGEEVQLIWADYVEIVMDSTIDEEVWEYYISEIIEKQDELKWLTIQVLIGLDRKEEAKSLLEELRFSEGNYEYVVDSLYNMIIR